MKKKLPVYFFFLTVFSIAQIGINTTDPKGALDVTAIDNTGLVLPRVASIEDVTDGNGNPPVDGTTVYDLSRNTTCFYQNDRWLCIGLDASGDPVLTDETIVSTFNNTSSIDYIKASNTDAGDVFGISISLSDDGNTMAVGSLREASNATGINGNQNDNSFQNGAVYVFVRTAGIWSQQAYIKTSTQGLVIDFGRSVSLSSDGNTLAIGTDQESNNATGINGNENNGVASRSGAAYVFVRTGTTWSQQAYIKASNAEGNDRFGFSLNLSNNGNTLAVGAFGEASNATGINGNQNDNSIQFSGAAYVFTRTGTTWTQEAYLKASNPDNFDFFGVSASLSGDGNTLAVGANGEASNSSGINGNQNDNSLTNSGAVYVFIKVAGVWSQQAYIKASNLVGDGNYARHISFSNNGDTMVVGSSGDGGVGSAYVFSRSGSTWTQEARLQSSNIENQDHFGRLVSISENGNVLAIGASGEDSNATGINGDQNNNSLEGSGAVYIFTRTGSTWTQQAYIKTTNPDIADGNDEIPLSLSGNGRTLAAGYLREASNATGINGNQANDNANLSGAVYVYEANSN